MTPGSAPVPRRLFLIESAPASDALIRILEPFALQQASLAAVALDAAPGALRVRVEADGLSDMRAETLRRRLAKLPLVTSVALGWRA
ncbi:MAG TPA: hypothetical protein VF459_08080 [Caulobacteraceae bacterium]